MKSRSLGAEFQFFFTTQDQYLGPPSHAPKKPKNVAPSPTAAALPYPAPAPAAAATPAAARSPAATPTTTAARSRRAPPSRRPIPAVRRRIRLPAAATGPRAIPAIPRPPRGRHSRSSSAAVPRDSGTDCDRTSARQVLRHCDGVGIQRQPRGRTAGRPAWWLAGLPASL